MSKMSQKSTEGGMASTPAESVSPRRQRERARVAAALRENLLRRKAQQRARRISPDPDPSADGDPVA